jgi:AcrR family transcriptional regulator
VPVTQSLAALSPRPLALALGTSDRMLIYHFGSRDGLLSAVLDALGECLRAVLGAAVPTGQQAPQVLLPAVVAAMQASEAEAIMRVWLEMCGLAARGEEPFAGEVRRVMQSWIAWLAPRLLTDDDPSTVAEALLGVADGLVLLRLVTANDVRPAAALISVGRSASSS